MNTRFILPAVAAALIPASALAAGAIEVAIAYQIAPYVVAGIVGILGAAVGWLAATSERFAGPARAKSAEERTLAEKAAIEIDRRIDQINIGIIETFATRWVDAHLDKVLATPVFDPMRQAGEMVDDAFERFKERNPEISEASGISKLSLKEILAAAIGNAMKAHVAAGAVEVRP